VDNLADRDKQALESRTGGTSFGAIARKLEYRGAPNAYDAFLRAFRRWPLLERARIRQDELARLAALRQQLTPAPISRPVSSEPNGK